MYNESPWTSGPNPDGLMVDVYANWVYGPAIKRSVSVSGRLPKLSQSVLDEMNLSPVVKQMAPAPASIQDEYLYSVQFATLPGDYYQKAYPMIYRGNDKDPIVSSSYVPPSRPTLMALAHDKLSVAQLPKTSNAFELQQGRVVQFTFINNDGGGRFQSWVQI